MLGEIRLIDLVDIVLVAGLVAAALAWVRRVRAGRAAAGLLTVVVLYLGARAVGLSLLTGLFEGSFALFVIVVVVIFQKELRRFFETVTVPGLAKSAHATSQHGLDLLVETVFDFARRGIGALIVISGKEAVDPHVSGGVELSGKLSRPLLHSLFDPHSAGHDGAAIVEGDRISRFAVHLPLSTNTEALADTGTRHAAALGLSEHCDALCIAVSEERHVVSIARGGELTEVHGAPELRGLLADAFADGPVAASRESFPRLRRYWVEAILSLLLAAGLWFVLVSGSIETERTYELPVTLVDFPAGLELEGVHPERVSVTFRGLSEELASAKAGDFEVNVDVSLARIGQRSFSIQEERIDRPPGLEVSRIEPRTIELTTGDD